MLRLIRFIDTSTTGGDGVRTTFELEPVLAEPQAAGAPWVLQNVLPIGRVCTEAATQFTQLVEYVEGTGLHSLGDSKAHLAERVARNLCVTEWILLLGAKGWDLSTSEAKLEEKNVPESLQRIFRSDGDLFELFEDGTEIARLRADRESYGVLHMFLSWFGAHSPRGVLLRPGSTASMIKKQQFQHLADTHIGAGSLGSDNKSTMASKVIQALWDNKLEPLNWSQAKSVGCETVPCDLPDTQLSDSEEDSMLAQYDFPMARLRRIKAPSQTPERLSGAGCSQDSAQAGSQRSATSRTANAILAGGVRAIR
jgi:hypothetical protein